MFKIRRSFIYENSKTRGRYVSTRSWKNICRVLRVRIGYFCKKSIFYKFKSLTGKTFDNKTVECSYIDENKYLKNDLEC